MTTKLQMQTTFKGWDAELLDQAVRIAAHHTGKEDEPDRNTRQWFVQWAVRAVARAVIAAKQVPCPLAVQLRFEFGCEMNARVELQRAMEIKIEDSPTEQIAVLVKGLEEQARSLRAIVFDRTAGMFPSGREELLIGNRWN
jgi:hypothetical protein